MVQVTGDVAGARDALRSFEDAVRSYQELAAQVPGGLPAMTFGDLTARHPRLSRLAGHVTAEFVFDIFEDYEARDVAALRRWAGHQDRRVRRTAVMLLALTASLVAIDALEQAVRAVVRWFLAFPPVAALVEVAVPGQRRRLFNPQPHHGSPTGARVVTLRAPGSPQLVPVWGEQVA